MRPRGLAVALAAVLLAAACDGDPPPDPTAPPRLNASVASYDLSADRPVRVMVGLFSNDGQVLSYGSVRFAFSYLGRQEAGSPQPGPEADAHFLHVPGEHATGGGEGPALIAASEARGVYAAEGVELDRPGLWEVEVTADVLDVGELAATASFTVVEEPHYPAPGDRALRTENHLPGAEGVPPGAIDSRAETPGEVPDPVLHELTIAQAIRQRRPTLVLFSTPVYCVSRFCGPVTDVVEQMATEHGGEAAFIHVEIWRDFQRQTINQAAADWILRDGDVLEPWLFLIRPDGVIEARWDNVFDPADVEAALERVSSNG